MVTKTAVIGIDLGSSDSYVSYVGKGVVDVVQNEVSKRSTPTLVGYTQTERLLGDTALSQIKSNAKNSCRNMKHLLGQKLDAPDVLPERGWSTCPLATAEDGFVGYDVSYKDKPCVMSAAQVTAAFFTKLRDVTETWCEAKVVDCVIGVPAYYSDVHRQALLDAAKIAGLSVLRLMNEHTATALSYGIYRSNDFDPEKPMTVAFCSMGHSIFSVSVVQFIKGKLTVICEASDKVGGRDMDMCLMKVFSAEFEKKHGCNPLDNKKASFKLEDAVGKTKKQLSSNSEAPVGCECLMNDEDLNSTINRADFLKMCEPMMGKVKAVLDKAVAEAAAAGIAVDTIDSIEVVGGSSRVPWVKEMCSTAFCGKELCTTMNADESVARGCALQAAILSPLYKVRDFKVEDISPHPISIGWWGAAADSEERVNDPGDTPLVAAADGEFKAATVFPANSQMNLLKMLTFYRTKAFDLKANYADGSHLIPGTPLELGTFKVDLPPQTEPKKVKVKAKLTLHGTFSIEGAQLVEEEDYDETVKEKRELPAEEVPAAEASPPASPPPETSTATADGDAAMPPADGDNGGDKAANGTDAEKKDEKPKEEKKPEKKYEWVDVVKRKTRTKRTDLNITRSGALGLADVVTQRLMDEETQIQADMRDIIETGERRNDLEGYIFTMRDKISSSGDYGVFISEADREKFNGDLTKGEDWLYDNFEATKVMYIEKLDELKAQGDPVVWRFKEDGIRGDWVAALQGTVKNYREAAVNPGDKYGHIAADKLARITVQCGETEKWLNDMKAKQDTMPKDKKPFLICADMEKKNQELAKMSDDILKEPKPAPPKEEKKEEKKEEEAPKEKEESAETKSPAEGNPDGPANMDVD